MSRRRGMRAALAGLLVAASAVAQANPAVERAIADRLQALAAQLRAGDVDGVLAAFRPDCPTTHAAFADDLRRSAAQRDGKQLERATLRTLAGPAPVGDRWAVVVGNDADGGSLRAVLCFAVTNPATPRAEPTFAATLPPRTDAGAVLAGRFRCPPCNYELDGAKGWLAVPQLPCRAQAIEGAAFHFAGTELVCDVGVRVADPGHDALATARSLGRSLAATATAVGIAVAWLPPALAERPPEGLRGARIDVGLPGDRRARLFVVDYGGLQQVFCAMAATDTLAKHGEALDRLLASYRPLSTDCNEADAAARSLEHHTGGVLVGSRYRNERFDVAFAAPEGWQALQRCSTMAIRVVWTSPNGARLWLGIYPTPDGLDRWCPQTADRWLAELQKAAGLDEVEFPPTEWRDDDARGGKVRDLTCRMRRPNDPLAPQLRPMRVWLRDGVLTVLDGVPKEPGETATLRAAFDRLSRTK